jgi:hypothetical protein
MIDTAATRRDLQIAQPPGSAWINPADFADREYFKLVISVCPRTRRQRARLAQSLSYLFIRASCIFSLSDILRRCRSGWLAIIYERLEIPEEKDRPSFIQDAYSHSRDFYRRLLLAVYSVVFRAVLSRRLRILPRVIMPPVESSITKLRETPRFSNASTISEWPFQIMNEKRGCTTTLAINIQSSRRY